MTATKESPWVRRIMFVRKSAIEGSPWASCYGNKFITVSLYAKRAQQLGSLKISQQR